MTETTQSGAPTGRRPARSRPVKPLPTDRMKFEVQVRILDTAAQMGKRTMDAEILSNAINNDVSHYTVALSHAFFVDSGWLERVARGEWRASEALLSYSRESQFDRQKALAFLRDAMKQGWVWQTIGDSLIENPLPQSSVLALLVHEAEASNSHQPQLQMVLEWLKFVGLVTISDGIVRVSGSPAAATGVPTEPDTPASPPTLAPVRADAPTQLGAEERPRSADPRPLGSINAESNSMSGIVNLRSGGTATISVSANIFDLSAEDLNFINGLVKTFQDYKNSGAQKPAGHSFVDEEV